MIKLTKKQIDLIAVLYTIILGILYFYTLQYKPTSFGWHVNNFILVTALIFVIGILVILNGNNDHEEKILMDAKRIGEEINNQTHRIMNAGEKDAHAKRTSLGQMESDRREEVESVNGRLEDLVHSLKPLHIIGSNALFVIALPCIAMLFLTPFAEMYIWDVIDSGVILIFIFFLSINALIIALYVINRTRDLHQRALQTNKIIF